VNTRSLASDGLLEGMVAQFCPSTSPRTQAASAAKFRQLSRLLQEWSQRFNITSIRDPQAIVVRHFVDSLLVLPLIPGSAGRIIDVGCGAGFPGLPVKICRPELEVAFLDSRQKALIFVKHAAATLGLKRVTFHHSRAEEAGKDPSLRERFDCAMAKALARPKKVLDLCLPFVRGGGRLIAFLPSGGLGEEDRAWIEASGLHYWLEERSEEVFGWRRRFLVVEKGGK